MASCQKRALIGWHERLAYAGLVVTSSRPRAANDNGRVRSVSQIRRYALIAQNGILVVSALTFVGGSFVLVGNAWGWW